VKSARDFPIPLSFTHLMNLGRTSEKINLHLRVTKKNYQNFIAKMNIFTRTYLIKHRKKRSISNRASSIPCFLTAFSKLHNSKQAIFSKIILGCI